MMPSLVLSNLYEVDIVHTTATDTTTTLFSAKTPLYSGSSLSFYFFLTFLLIKSQSRPARLYSDWCCFGASSFNFPMTRSVRLSCRLVGLSKFLAKFPKSLTSMLLSEHLYFKISGCCGYFVSAFEHNNYSCIYSWCNSKSASTIPMTPETGI